MNLNAYDKITDDLDKTKTWIDIKKKTLLSREIKARPYYTLLKRYNPNTNINTYFIAMLNAPDVNKKCYLTRIDNYGRIKIKLTSIWKDIYLSGCETNCNIVVSLVESDEMGDIYNLDL